MNSRWSALAAMVIIQISGSFGFYALTVLTPFIKAEFQLSTSAVGLLVISMYLGYLIALLPGGLLTDQFGERVVMVLSITCIGTGAIISSIVPAYWLLFVGLFVLGIGYGPVPSATNKGVFDWFPAEQRTTSLSIKQTGVMVGSAAAGLSLPAIATRTDWRFALAGMAGILFMTFGVLALYSSPEDAPTSNTVTTVRDLRTEFVEMGSLVRAPRLRALVISGFFFGASQFTLMAYILLYLNEELLIVPVIGGLLYTLAQLSGAVTRISLGFVTDAWFTENKHLLLASTGLLGAILYLPFVVFPSTVPLSLVGASIIGIGAVTLGYNGVYLTIASELSSPEKTGSATAISVTSVVLGGIITPPIFGWFVDVSGSYGVSFGLLAGCMLLAGLMALRVGAYSPHDLSDSTTR